jgi:hypothetical protein
MRVLVVALAILTGCTGGAHAPSPGAAASSGVSARGAGGDWVTYRDPQWLFEIEHPPSWEPGPLLVSHGDWRQWEMLALATYPLRAGEGRCSSHLPVAAFEDLGPRDALLYVQEPEYVEGLPARRGPFDVAFSTSADHMNEISVFRCLDAGTDFRYAFVPFSDGGRSFHAYLALGMDAPERTRRDLISAFDSLEILTADEFRARS